MTRLMPDTLKQMSNYRIQIFFSNREKQVLIACKFEIYAARTYDLYNE
jgi:hypothetical protein